MLKLNLQLFGGRGSAGGNSKASAESKAEAKNKVTTNRKSDKVTTDNLTSPHAMATQAYDMIKGDEFSDEEKTRTFRTYMDRLIQNPKAFRDEWIANQRVLYWAEQHGGSKRFPKLSSYRAAVEKQESVRQTSNAMSEGIRRAKEEAEKRSEESKKIADNMRKRK